MVAVLLSLTSEIRFGRLGQFRCCQTLAGLAFAVGILFSAAAKAGPIERDPTSTGATSEKRPPEVLDAIKRYEGGDAEKAFELLKSAAAKYPNLAPPRVMFANMYF